MKKISERNEEIGEKMLHREVCLIANGRYKMELSWVDGCFLSMREEQFLHVIAPSQEGR